MENMLSTSCLKIPLSFLRVHLKKTVNSGSFEANYDFIVQLFTIKSKVGL